MSDSGSSEPMEPTQPAGAHEHTQPLTAYETVGPAGSGGGRGRRSTIIGGVAAVVVLVLAGGAYAAWSFLDGGGPKPEEVLPASTVAVMSVDLDPSAGQKIAAIKTIRKFPALKEELGLEADDDVRKFLFDKLVEENGCKGLTFADDVEPWLGKRAAFGAVDLGGEDPAPVMALQVSDAGKAKTGLDKIIECSDPEDFAYVVGEEYVIASDTPAHAKTILEKGRTKPLSDDASYQKWTGELGDKGVINFYVAKKAADYFSAMVDDELGSGLEGDLEEEFGDDLGGDLGDDDFSAGSSAGTRGSAEGARAAAADVLKDFKGLAGTVRFADGGAELATVAGGLNRLGGATVGKHVGNLPGDTAAAIGLAVPDDFVRTIFDQVDSFYPGSSGDFQTMMENQTGLDLPEDLQTLLGDSVTVSLGGEAPDSFSELDGPDKVPAGLVIHGDADAIKDVIAKIERRLGTSLSEIPLTVEYAGDRVAMSPGDYGSELLKDGDLASKDNFRGVVPESERASWVLYVDFDSPWRETVADAIAEDEGGAAGKEFDQNSEPLEALGISSWHDGDVTHTLTRISTD